jgi:hypothetical protein
MNELVNGKGSGACATLNVDAEHPAGTISLDDDTLRPVYSGDFTYTDFCTYYNICFPG